MSELRRNPLTGQWVIIAENRHDRPHDVAVQHTFGQRTNCPFCEGHEELTPSEIAACRVPNTLPNRPGWRVRVVENKFPALSERAPTNALFAAGQSDTAVETTGLHSSIPGYGRHEIIIESPRHLSSVTELSDQQFAEVLDIYRQRLMSLQSMKQFGEALLFKNAGPDAGATLGHLHSQLIAPELPRRMNYLDRSVAFDQHFERYGQCLLCQMAREETAECKRLVAQSSSFVAFCPFASRFAYEIWIIPREHQAQYYQLDPKSLPDLAGLFRDVLLRLEKILKSPAYNYILHTAPFDMPTTGHYHWHIEILPRIANLAGFELGMGSFLNTVRPELAAAALQK